MSAGQNYGAHSAQVKMRLILNGLSVRITHMGPDFLFVESPPEHPPSQATIALSVDGSESQWQVSLPHGISANSKRVTIALPT